MTISKTPVKSSNDRMYLMFAVGTLVSIVGVFLYKKYASNDMLNKDVDEIEQESEDEKLFEEFVEEAKKPIKKVEYPDI